MKESPLVSILITNYNNADYIVESLESAINQTYQNIEIVIVDDKSTDDSVQVAQSFINLHPDYKFILYVSPENKGCPGSKRKSVELCHGEYFIFLDSDDAITPDAIEQLLRVMMTEKGRYSIVYSTQYLCDGDLNPICLSDHCGRIPEGQSNLNSKSGHISYVTFCSKKYYDLTTGINVDAGLAEDQDFYFKMEEVAPVCYVDVPMYYYRKHEHNISNNVASTTRNKYWILKAKEAAYYRRKQNHSDVPNLTKRELQALRLEYHIVNATSLRLEKKQWVCEFMRVLLYTPFSIRKGLRGMKKILSVH